MTDRELLEAAARAAGIAGRWVDEDGPYQSGIIWTDAEDFERGWSPLTDDGDALRLMTQMGMSVNTGRKLTICAKAKRAIGYVHEFIGDDLRAATRRAIVRAAAAMAGEKT